MNYTPSIFKSLAVATKEAPSFYKAQTHLTEITPKLKETIARMHSKALSKLNSSQRNESAKVNQRKVESPRDITKQSRWNNFVDTFYRGEDLLVALLHESDFKYIAPNPKI